MIMLFVLAHLIADFVLQPLWLVRRKRTWNGLLIHGAIVLACMLALPLAEPATLQLWPVMLAITAVHIAADWWKVRHADGLFKPPILPFMLDQVVHLATIVLALSLALPAAQVWGMGGSLITEGAVYASAFIVAAFAVPIGVMVWLDPRFEHAALAGKARVRCVAASSAVLVLTLLGGIVALPTVLLGLTLLIRRPFSPHPLDTPVGMMVVLSVAATLATALILLPL